MLLQLCTWREVEAYLERATGILIPVGSTEQHGPNGMIGTDAICPETIGRGVGERTGALVGPTLSVGMAQHHLGFPGSVSLRPSTLLALVVDVVRSLAGHGFDRIYFLNGHGGNVPTLNAAFSEVYAGYSMGAERSGTAPHCTVTNWWRLPAVTEVARRRFGNAEGGHATPSEVSLTFFAYPDHVKHADMHPDVAPYGPIYDAADYRRRFPDGRIGSNPALASVEAGAELYEAAVGAVAAEYQRFVAGE